MPERGASKQKDEPKWWTASKGWTVKMGLSVFYDCCWAAHQVSFWLARRSLWLLRTVLSLPRFMLSHPLFVVRLRPPGPAVEAGTSESGDDTHRAMVLWPTPALLLWILGGTALV